MNEETFNELVENCKEYIADELDTEWKEKYTQDLNEILAEENEKQRWAMFIASGIFHDAIGEWERVEEPMLYVSIDY